MSKLIYRWTSPRLGKRGQELLRATIDSGQWSYGPIARQLEREIAHQLGQAGALLTNSGTSALWILLSLARTKQKQAIIVPAFGYSAAANIAATLGYDVYVADCQDDAPIIDPASIERLMDEKVAIVIGINYFGYAVDWDKISTDDGYQLIEDAAGSFGARYKDHPCGSNAPNAILSFHTSKAVAAGGEGGCIVSSDRRILDAAKAIGRNGHVTGYYYAEMPGMNMLMTDVAACFLHDTVQRFTEATEKRKYAVRRIEDILASLNIPTPSFNHTGNGRIQNYQTYVALLPNRDRIIDMLRINGIETRPCWPFLITDQPAFADVVKKIDGRLSNARYFADRIINIPINPSLDNRSMERLETALVRLHSMGMLTDKESTHA